MLPLYRAGSSAHDFFAPLGATRRDWLIFHRRPVLLSASP